MGKAVKNKKDTNRDVVKQYVTWFPNYGGNDVGNINVFAYEVPFGFMNMQTLGVVGGENYARVRRYRYSSAVATFHVPQAAQKQDSVIRPYEIFLGFNFTPQGLQQKTVESAEGYLKFKDKCDIIKTSGNSTSISLPIPTSGWRKYLGTVLYNQYKDLLDRQNMDYCYGSIILGFIGFNTDVKKDEFQSMLQIRGAEELQLSKIVWD